MKISHSLVACGVLALTSAAGTALADDGKALPGSACQPLTFSRSTSLSLGGATISNFSTSSFEHVACPVTKDIEAGRLKRAEVMLIDRSPVANHDIECTLATHRKDGGLIQTETKKSNSSFNVALPISFGAQSAALQGSYTLICSLPPMATVAGSPAPSTIVMYNVVEQ
jgi:hypothetical protein